MSLVSRQVAESPQLQLEQELAAHNKIIIPLIHQRGRGRGRRGSVPLSLSLSLLSFALSPSASLSPISLFLLINSLNSLMHGVPVVLDQCMVEAVLVGVGSLPSVVISLVEEGSLEVETRQQAKVDTPSRSLGPPWSPTL